MVLKERLDTLLVKRGFFLSRNKARAAILAGLVEVGGRIVDKPGSEIDANERIAIKERPEYVSRGGVKLEKAVKEFSIDVAGKVFLDVGASTGGFTDFLLSKGAKKVIAVDVGYGQLAWNLRTDPRVQLLERSNIRHVKREQLSELPDVAVVDVSFISAVKVMPNLLTLVKPEGEVIILVKPQFEIGKGRVGRGGIVSNIPDHKEVLTDLWNAFTSMGLSMKGLTYSPIRGAAGNIEFFMYLTPNKEKKAKVEIDAEVSKVVDKAHCAFSLKECSK